MRSQHRDGRGPQQLSSPHLAWPLGLGGSILGAPWLGDSVPPSPSPVPLLPRGPRPGKTLLYIPVPGGRDRVALRSAQARDICPLLAPRLPPPLLLELRMSSAAPHLSPGSSNPGGRGPDASNTHGLGLPPREPPRCRGRGSADGPAMGPVVTRRTPRGASYPPPPSPAVEVRGSSALLLPAGRPARLSLGLLFP